jgi:hypothetical protein
MFRYVTDAEADDIRQELAKAKTPAATPDGKNDATAKNSAAEARDASNAQKQPR